MKIDHIGVAVESIDAAAPFYLETLGLIVGHREDVPGQKTRVAFLRDPAASEEEAQVELLEPLGDDGPVAKFIQTRGAGLHHVAFRSPDIAAAMRRMKEQGRPALESAPRPGARGHEVCFLHPKHAHGVLVELVG